MNFKRYIEASDTWVDSHYIMGTSTDTLTTLPAVLYPNDTTATVGLKGNTVQSGTPTPENPVMPQGTGDKTANLLYASSTGTTTAPLVISYTNNSAEFTLNKESTSANVSAAVLCDITLDAGTYSIKVQGLNSAGTKLDRVYLVDSNNNIVINNVINNTAVQFTLAETTTIAKIAFVAGASSIYSNKTVTIMLNTGSTAKPYEPFGVKIPISSASTTTPIYLGEVESTRQIKKLVLDGTENWYVEGSDIFYTDPITEAARHEPICSHFRGIYIFTDNNQITISQTLRINIKTNSITHTVSDFKTYLAQQYAAGTPVTIWYVLATPTTGIVNEPLMKIGDYADEVANVSIPVTAGGDTISVDTTVQPSEVTVNYKGWHDATVKEWDGSQWS